MQVLRNNKSILLLVGFIFSLFQNCFAQDSAVEMATGLRANGKIYVVVIVLCIIFIGIILYLFSIDRKVKQLEKELKK